MTLRFDNSKDHNIKENYYYYFFFLKELFLLKILINKD